MNDSGTAAHNDSSVSSASQLLENPSPLSWAFCSFNSDIEGEFPLKRQKGIRRKRPARDTNRSSCKKAKTEIQLVEAVNRHVKRLALETDLDTYMDEDVPKVEIDLEQNKDSVEDQVEMIMDEDVKNYETVCIFYKFKFHNSIFNKKY